MREHARPWRDAQPVCKVAIADTVLNSKTFEAEIEWIRTCSQTLLNVIITIPYQMY